MRLCAATKRLMLWAVILLLPTDSVLSQNNDSSVKVIDPTENVTDIFGVPAGEDEGSGDIDPGAFNTTAIEETDSLPHLVVKDNSGSPCLLATLNATMQVSYRVPEGIVHETYIALAEIQLPEDVKAEGVCGENISRLLLDWGNNTFHVNMTFTKKEPKDRSSNATWSLTAMSISYDLSNTNVFLGASDTDTVTVEKQGLSLFNTNVGNTHICNNHIKTQAGSNERGVVVNFHNVIVAAFGVKSSEFPETVEYCSKMDESDDHEDILVPLIIACCLSAVVIIVVIAYVISRKVQEAREQSEYRPMP